MRGSFVEIDHSGDVGIEARGENLAELIASLTQGLCSLLARGKVDSSVRRSIRIESQSYEDLVVDWLGEVISCVGTHGEMYGAVEIRDAGEFFVEGVLKGEPVEPDKHDLRFDVKAATYHELVVRHDQDGWLARVIFDL